MGNGINKGKDETMRGAISPVIFADVMTAEMSFCYCFPSANLPS